MSGIRNLLTNHPIFVYYKNTHMISEPDLNDLERRVFDLCSAVYRLARLFPENEIINSQIKEAANIVTAEVLAIERIGSKMPLNVPASYVQNAFSEMLLSAVRNIEKLIGFLWIAKAQDWVNPVNFDVLIEGYEKIQNMLATREVANAVAVPKATHAIESLFMPSPKPEIGFREPILRQSVHRSERPAPKPAPKKDLNPRQKKLLDIIRKQGEARMADFLGIFKNSVTERTLRNDLRDLAEQGFVRAEGEFKTRKYHIK